MVRVKYEFPEEPLSEEQQQVIDTARLTYAAAMMIAALELSIELETVLDEYEDEWKLPPSVADEFEKTGQRLNIHRRQ